MTESKKIRPLFFLPLIVILLCAHRDNPNDPQSPYYKESPLSIESVEISQDTVYAEDTTTFIITIRYIDGSIKEHRKTSVFTEPGIHYLVFPAFEDSLPVIVLDSQA
ncbi:MAG: hypothetical protein GF401_19475 [Chitinivibrionales bacterium]|nr:hypothetical protein [Chitinivibrionales bacterium]